MHTFVNGRAIYSPVIIHAIDFGYKTFIQPSKHPACVINIEIQPELIDVKRITMPAVMAEKAAEDNQSINIIASTRQMDHDREVLFPMGCDLSIFKASPKILESHDRSKAFVAKATKVSRNSENIPMTIEFAPTDDGEKYRILSKFSPLSFSVGFIHNSVIFKSLLKARLLWNNHHHK